MPRQRAAEKGLRARLRSRTWQTEPTRRAVRDGRSGPNRLPGEMVHNPNADRRYHVYKANRSPKSNGIGAAP